MAGEWTMYAISKYFGDRHRESIDTRIKRMRARTADARADVVDRVATLEDNLGRVLLLLSALSETCISKGVVTREELAAMAEQVDLDDGIADGKLDPTILRPEEDERPSAVTPEEHLRRLEEES